MQDVTAPQEDGLAPKARRGRPRDEGLEDRVFDAALTLYANQGWQGFNFDAVARRAGVGKDALYRRWGTRDALLTASLKRRWDWVGVIDEGALRLDLLALARATFGVFAGPYGEVALQLRADSRRFEEVRAFADPYRERLVHEGRAIVSRAIARGDITEAARPALIMDLLMGGILNHISSTPEALKARMHEQADRFITDVVEVILRGSAGLSARHD